MAPSETDQTAMRTLLQLERMNRLLAMNLVKDLALRERVRSLDVAGFTPKEIGEIIGKTSNHVSVILHDLRKKPRDDGTEVPGTSGDAAASTGGF